MAEVFGIVTGVLGLLPLCRDGLSMTQDVFDSAGTLGLAVGRLELQRDLYDQWRDIWRSDDGQYDINFEDYAKANPAGVKRVQRQLALMAQAMFDVQVLEEQYGIKADRWPDRIEFQDLTRYRLRDGDNLTVETQGTFLKLCKHNMAFIKRCKFMFRRKEATWINLIERLKECIETLTIYGPTFELEKMRKLQFQVLKNLQLEELRRRAEAATYEAQHSPPESEERAHFHTLSLAAQFSTVVKFERQHTAYKFTMRDFRLDPAYEISSSAGSSTMALLFDYPVRKENRVVLIEWIEDHDLEQERITRTKVLMLATPKPDQVLLPKCYGMVDDPLGGRFGLVLAPPNHIRSNLPPILPAGAISQKRMPVSLRELIERKHASCPGVLDLGIRFRLAKRLVEAVHMMHCVGWVHKNIRSNSILFFPAANKPSRGPAGPASGFPQPLGYSEPIFVGLGNARIDDIINDRNSYYDEEDEVLYVNEMGQRIRHMQIAKRRDDSKLDYYQHPEKRRNPLPRYCRAHDIYSLGCVLLEIGLWKPLHEMVEVEDDDYERVKRGFLSLTMDLVGAAGSIYSDVVQKCLSVSTRERTDAEQRELSRFCAEIAATLDKCWA